ncbi:MAG TPA: hypothetical protein VL523_03785, partial [Terriglobia bacterium]|nr:hypothetical protein [Terriglobia bacterium]
GYWHIQEGEEPERRTGRRPPVVFPPRNQNQEWVETPLLRRSKDDPAGYELPLVSLIRERVEAWRAAVNADGAYGAWPYALAKRPTEVPGLIGEAAGARG